MPFILEVLLNTDQKHSLGILTKHYKHLTALRTRLIEKTIKQKGASKIAV